MKKYENNTNCYMKTFTRRYIMKLCTRGFTAETIERNRYVNNSRLFMEKHILMMAAGWAPPCTRQLSNRILNFKRCRWAGGLFYFQLQFQSIDKSFPLEKFSPQTNFRNENTTPKTIPTYNSV